MRNLVALLIGVAVLSTMGTASAVTAARSDRNTAVRAHERAISQDCRSGVWVQSDLRRLYDAARATDDHGYLATPASAEDACNQAP